MRSDTVLIILGMAVVTFMTRFGSFIFFRQTGIPAWLERWLKHVPTAILTSLIVPSLLLPKGEFDLTFGNSYLLAGIVAVFVAYKSRNAMTTLSVSMAAMFLLRWLS